MATGRNSKVAWIRSVARWVDFGSDPAIAYLRVALKSPRDKFYLPNRWRVMQDILEAKSMAVHK